MKLPKIIFSILAIIVIAYFSLTSFISCQMTESSNKTWDAMNNEDFPCPDGTEEKKERWSKLGYSRKCVPLVHGKWEGWSEGYKYVEGLYDHGVKNGKWVWYKKDGSISQVIEYSQGEKISKEIFEKKQ